MRKFVAILAGITLFMSSTLPALAINLYDLSDDNGYIDEDGFTFATGSPSDEWGTFDGPAPSNYYPDEVHQYTVTTGNYIDETSDARDSDTNDVKIGMYEKAYLYIGFDQPFDGFAIDISTDATGGDFIVEYYDGDTWEDVSGGMVLLESDFENDGSDPFSVIWPSIPEDWSLTSVNGSDDVYFARVRITSDYSNVAYGTKVGIVKYNLTFTDIEDELGNEVNDLEANVNVAFLDNGGPNDGYIYSSRSTGNVYEFALNASDSSDPEYDYAVYVPGYQAQYINANMDVGEDVTERVHDEVLEFAHKITITDSEGADLDIDSASATANTIGPLDCEVQDNEAYCAVPFDQDDDDGIRVNVDGYVTDFFETPGRSEAYSSPKEVSGSLDYAYLFTVENEDGDVVEGATVLANGGTEITCDDLGSGEYGCAVYVDDSTVDVDISADGYEDLNDELSGSDVRSAASDAQVAKTFVLAEIDETDSDSDGLTDDEEATEGTDPSDPDSDDDGLVDGEEVNSYGTDPLDDDTDGGGVTDGNEVVNGTDPLDSSDDETGDPSDPDTDGDGLTDSEEATHGTEPDDADSDNDGLSDGDEVNVYGTYPLEEDSDGGGEDDGDEVDNGRDPLDDSDDEGYGLGEDGEDDDDGDGLTNDEEDFLGTDPDDEDTDGDGVSDYIEYETDTDPLDDDDWLADWEDYGAVCSDPFYDTSDSFAETAICLLYNDGVVSGKSTYYFEPSDAVTRAEFLKIILGSAGETLGSYSDDYYVDVPGEEWYYPYIAHATEMGYVEGYDDGSFMPDDPIGRDEAVVIVMRVYGEELYGYTESDIDFSDVDVDDWFAYAVILASENHVVQGYDDETFRPGNDITRAEVAVIARRAYYAF